MKNAVLAGGGTAGHVNPLLATAAELMKRGWNVRAVGTPGGLEEELVPEAGLPLDTITRAPFPRRLDAAALHFPRDFRRAIAEATAILKESEADVVIGFGGFASSPVYVAARRLGIPFLVHEQNARPGLANKLGARHASAVALTFSSTPLRARKGATVVTGLPLRESIRELAAATDRAGLRAKAGWELGIDPRYPTVLVTGGSLGAQRLNEVMGAAGRWFEEMGIQVCHISGHGKFMTVMKKVWDVPHYRVIEYQKHMEYAYAAADLVVCRAGAGTVAEISAVGVPAVYVPLPIGNGEQKLNAADAVREGAALLIADEDFGEDAIHEIIALMQDEPRRHAMATAARKVSPVDGASRLADLAISIAEKDVR